MNEPTYEEALIHFRKQPIYWNAIINGIKEGRDAQFAVIRRNMNAPNCNERADAKALGYMMAYDDIACDFKGSEATPKPQE